MQIAFGRVRRKTSPAAVSGYLKKRQIGKKARNKHKPLTDR